MYYPHVTCRLYSNDTIWETINVTITNSMGLQPLNKIIKDNEGKVPTFFMVISGFTATVVFDFLLPSWDTLKVTLNTSGSVIKSIVFSALPRTLQLCNEFFFEFHSVRTKTSSKIRFWKSLWADIINQGCIPRGCHYG